MLFISEKGKLNGVDITPIVFSVNKRQLSEDVIYSKSNY